MSSDNTKTNYEHLVDVGCKVAAMAAAEWLRHRDMHITWDELAPLLKAHVTAAWDQAIADVRAAMEAHMHPTVVNRTFGLSMSLAGIEAAAAATAAKQAPLAAISG